MSSTFFNMPQIGQNQANSNQPYQLGFYDLKLQSVMIYNPTLEPNVRKPSEEDIQDAKLIYYYPSSVAIQEKRNHVGLAEGNFQFWNSFFIGQEEEDEDDQDIKNDSSADDQSKKKQQISQQIDLLSDEPTLTEEQKQDGNKQQQQGDDKDSEKQNKANEKQDIEKQQQQEEQKLKKKKFKEGKNVQITIFDRYIHAQEEVEENVWLYMVFAKPEGCDLPYKVHDEDNTYYTEETGTFTEQRISENHIRTVLRHFYDTFWMFFSEMQFHITADKRGFINLMDQFILRYLDLNGDEFNKSLNVLRYQFQGFQYAPIEKNIFLTLQSLVNILSTMDNRVKQYCIYFGGYFIYSTLNHDKAFALYEYFYSQDKPFTYTDKKLQSRFAFPQLIQEHEELSYGNIFNSHRVGVSKTQSQSSTQGNTSNISALNYAQIDGFVEKTNETVNLQNIFFKDNKGEKEKYQMNIYYEKQLMIIMFYEANQIIRKDKIIEMNTAISRNCEKIAGRIEKAIFEQQKKEESYKYLYFNHMNIATKISNPLTLNSFLTQEIDTITNIYNQLQNDTLNYSSTQLLVKSANIWIYGYKNVSRIVIMIFPGTLSLPKVYEESEKLFKNYFPLLYM